MQRSRRPLPVPLNQALGSLHSTAQYSTVQHNTAHSPGSQLDVVEVGVVGLTYFSKTSLMILREEAEVEME